MYYAFNHMPTWTNKYVDIRLAVKITREDMLLHIRTQTPVFPPPFCLQVNTESQMASGAVQNELVLKAWCCESLAFYKRSVARRRPPESQPAFGKRHSERAHRSKQFSFLHMNEQSFCPFEVHATGRSRTMWLHVYKTDRAHNQFRVSSNAE